MKSQNVLLLGSGGREHALAWKISQSQYCGKLFIGPGNPGTAQCGRNVRLALNDFQGIHDFCVEKSIDVIVVGPEAPLVDGLVNFLKNSPQLESLVCIGPSRKGAMLEGSKAFAKEFMQRNGVPTAAYREFNQAQLADGISYIENHALPVVLKADGLAGGKGVLICTDTSTAIEEFKLMLDGKFGSASAKVVVEEFLDGIEFSVFAITDGKDYQLLPIAKDYKRIGEGDTGLNTGGMGSISPVPFVDEDLMHKVVQSVVKPTIDGLAKEQIDYHGFVFFGLICVDNEPFVIEYNCRMGDPETQSVMPRIKSDLLQLLVATGQGNLAEQSVEFHSGHATTVVCVSGGYPGSYLKGKPMHIPSADEGSIVFHAGTKEVDGQLVTAGGRVIALTSVAETMQAALDKSMSMAREVDYDGKYFRSDIGFDL